jgi:putative acetyltransferase
MGTIVIRLANVQDRQRLFEVWQGSAQANHDFVTPEDLAAMIPQVKGYFESAMTSFWIACTDDQQIVGFMGLSGSDMESLFLLPEFQGRGIGTSLVEHAQTLHDVLKVDVNEQNGAAFEFYLARGFKLESRSERDRQQRPYPLLRMTWSRAGA